MGYIYETIYHLINLFFISIFYFILIRAISSFTFNLFPKFVRPSVSNINGSKMVSTRLLIEALFELGTISCILYLCRTLFLHYGSLFLTQNYNMDYEKYAIFVINPALFSGPSDLKEKLDYVF